MPPKKGAAPKDVDKAKEELVAVLLADSFAQVCVVCVGGEGKENEAVPF